MRRKIVRNIEENVQVTRIREENRQYKAHPDDLGLASKLLEECNAFLTDHPGSDQVATVQGIRAEVQAVVSTMTRARNHEGLRHQLTQSAESPWRCYQLCTGFLKNDPSHPKAREVEADRDRFLGKADDKAWDEVIQHARNYPRLFPEQIAQCEDYMHNVLFTTHQVEAAAFKELAIIGQDRASYEAIRKKAGDGADPVTLSVPCCVSSVPDTSTSRSPARR